ncbi:exosortase A [Thauera humireducens]|uniref:exosortase A n=1 Tax=Thauera humireducens TaxID=1134435 RepID=UPI00311D7A30
MAFRHFRSRSRGGRPIFVWLVWRARGRIDGLQPRPVAWMTIPVVGAGVLWMVGGMVSVAAAQHFALFAMLVSALVGVLGWQLSRALLFPLLFLFFGVPIGEFMLPTLMHYTAEFTVWALRLSGVPVYQEGLHFIVPNGRWSVVEACSGVRYLIASLFVGALYAYLNYAGLKRRVLFMLVAVAVPVIANWIRAYMIVMLGYHSDNRIAVGVDHLLYGWVFFGVVIFLMFWIGSRWHEVPAGKPLQGTDGADHRPSRAYWFAAIPLLAATAAFPYGLKALNVPVADFPVSITAPAPAAEWTVSMPNQFDYRPVYAGARAEATQFYVADSAMVGVHAAWYFGQRDGREMIAWGNGPAPSSREALSLVRSARTLMVDSRPVRENFISTSQGHVLAWHWYRVNGRMMVGDAEAKLRLAMDRLLGMPDESAVVVLFTPVGLDEEAARARLRAFLASHAQALDKAVEEPSRAIPE